MTVSMRLPISVLAVLAFAAVLQQFPGLGTKMVMVGALKVNALRLKLLHGATDANLAAAMDFFQRFSDPNKVATVQTLREDMNALSTLMLPWPTADYTTTRVDIPGLPTGSYWVRTPNARADKVVLYFHGGAYMGGHAAEWFWTYYISQQASVTVLLVEYRLAPEHPLPAAIEDGLTAYQWLLESQAVLPQNIVVAGDSAGGGLSLNLLRVLWKRSLPQPAAMAVSYTHLTLPTKRIV
eukprot:TRINITY_DN33791_c0_g1_i1.p1 TRINITY_DN33791_c0_g1~~TRINITY_DN33791_c0_g1_i1.p1  ORF type:complete len:238 (-),score=47.24 TRINITY_DN33791_c0_g1_i1:49-762(-)